MSEGPVVVVEGMSALLAALAKADRDTRLGVRHALRDVGEPVRHSAEVLAQANIRRVGKKWFKMRIGITRKMVYVAPRQRGVKTTGRLQLRRPNMGDLLMNRAMQPALDAHRTQLNARMERFVDVIADDFNSGGVV